MFLRFKIYGHMELLFKYKQKKKKAKIDRTEVKGGKKQGVEWRGATEQDSPR